MSQNSELTAGLIFHAPLSEDYPSTDLVSLSKGTITSVYPVLDRQGSGRREYSFNGSTNYVALPTIPAFGTGDFTVVMNVDLLNLNTYNVFLGNIGNGFGLYATANGQLISQKNGVGPNSGSTTYITIGKHSIQYKRLSGVGTYYMDGISLGSITDAFDYTVQTGTVSNSSSAISGSISMCRIFNYALSPTQIANYSRPEYPIEWVDRGVGASKNILDLNAEGATSAYWYDKTNSLTATVSGASLIKPTASNLGSSYFNGTTSGIIFSTKNDLLGDISISGWINVQANAPSTVGTIIWESGVTVIRDNIGAIRLSRDGGGHDMGSGNIGINSWHNVIFTSKADGYSNVYIDGVLNGSANQFAGTPSIITGNRGIGIRSNNSYNFLGFISDIRIYSRILSADEIQGLYQGMK